MQFLFFIIILFIILLYFSWYARTPRSLNFYSAHTSVQFIQLSSIENRCSAIDVRLPTRSDYDWETNSLWRWRIVVVKIRIDSWMVAVSVCQCFGSTPLFLLYACIGVPLLLLLLLLMVIVVSIDSLGRCYRNDIQLLFSQRNCCSHWQYSKIGTHTRKAAFNRQLFVASSSRLQSAFLLHTYIHMLHLRELFVVVSFLHCISESICGRRSIARLGTKYVCCYYYCTLVPRSCNCLNGCGWLLQVQFLLCSQTYRLKLGAGKFLSVVAAINSSYPIQ